MKCLNKYNIPDIMYKKLKISLCCLSKLCKSYLIKMESFIKERKSEN